MSTPTTAGVADLDPFERFNRMNGMGRIENPYPVFVELRNEAPIQKADLRKMFGLQVPDPPPGSPPVYSASSYEAVVQVLRDGETFSSAMYSAVMGIVMGHSILEMDEPEHHRYRALLQQAFTKRSLELWEHSLVGAVIDELIDAFIHDGKAELVRQLTFPFPVNVIAGLLGLPREDIPQFHRWTVELISVGIDFEGAIRASNALKEYLSGFLAERRVNPGDDMISVLAHSELDGVRLDDEDIYAFLRLLLPAGAETTYRSSSNLLYGLLTHPDQLAAVVADRSLIPQTIEEGLRWEPPLLTIMRSATKDTEVCGVPVEKDAVIIVNMGSANHDESRWDNPEDLDIFRKATQHIAFAFGPHMCLGQHLARMETRVLLEKVFDRLPNLRIDTEAPEGPITGMTFRSPTAIPVLFG
jgi:cytochrome P450